jgi:ADP-heptose:LPS heptosyltransferase
MPDSPAILVFRVGLLGDTVVALPAIDAVRKRFPGRRLVLLTSRPANPAWVSPWDVLGPTGWFDEAIFYDPSVRSPANLARLGWMTLALRRRRFESAFVLAPPRGRRQALRDRIFFQSLCGIPRCFTAAPMAPSAVRSAVGEREGLRLLRVVEPRAGQRDVDAFRLRIPQHERQIAVRALIDAGIRPGQPMVAFAPGTRMPAKQWPEERFRAAGTALLARFPALTLVGIGGADEAALCERLCAAWGARARNLAGRLSVYGSAEILSRCAAYVGNDSGPMHLAAVVGTPCVAVFSAREARGRWDPFGTRHIVLRKQTECAGCMLEECEAEASRCLTAIRVEQVVRAATLSMGDAAAGGARARELVA